MKLPLAKIKPILYKAILISSSLVFLFVLSVYWGAWGDLPDNDDLLELSQQEASTIYDVNNELIGSFFLTDRQPIKQDEIPEHLRQALLATEDIRFYEHHGIDYKSLARVFFKSILLQDRSGGGGSTLTQQLAKNLFPRKSFGPLTLPVNKTKEMLIAKRLEHLYTKEELLLLYLNAVPFSGNTYGIESASFKFFNKKAAELSVVEAATLIGTLKATYSYNPQQFPERSLKRRNTVLDQMEKYGFLSSDRVDSLQEAPLELSFNKYDPLSGLAPYFREALRVQMNELLAKNDIYNLYTSGLKIHTTLDAEMQRLAEKAAETHMNRLQNNYENEYGANPPWSKKGALFQNEVKKLSAYRKLGDSLTHDEKIKALAKIRTAKLPKNLRTTRPLGSPLDSLEIALKQLSLGFVAMDPQSGAVRAWIGGADFKQSKYDHVRSSKRQVGSTFKPIVYITALEQGIDPCSYFSARQVSYENLENWTPSNSGNRDEAYLNYSMSAALSKSINTVAVKVLEEAGIQNTIQQARKMGIQSDLPEVPSIALGTASLSVLEMAKAYSAVVNQGNVAKPHIWNTVTTKKGDTLYQYKAKADPPAFSKRTQELILEMMKETVRTGTAERIRSSYGLRNAMAAKTGTTQANKDAWFVALMPEMVTVTWVGNDNYQIGFKSTALGQGANAALPVTARWLQALNRNSRFDSITKASFPQVDPEVTAMLDCEPTKRDGFLKRLFTNPDKTKTKKFRKRNSN
ncbi:transglycosylase domain-containing protein [Croceiramulus getboli]|nr:transglycosylase domain-containing protein [Flavobacteriaceae bacterium YJPT1-3]